MTEARTMGTMHRILQLMVDKKASDVYLSAHSPAMIKINGEAIPINAQILPPNAPMNLLAEVLPPERIEELEEIGELNLALPVAGMGNFRISGFRQRNTYAAVIRYIPTDIPRLDSLNLPPILADLIMEKRGFVAVVDHRRQRGAFAGAGRADHQQQAALFHDQVGQNRR